MSRGRHLRFENLGVQRGERWVFRHLTLEVPRGAFVAVVGPSGVGKSSLLSCLAGLLPADEGQVLREERPGLRVGAPGQIGVIFQNNLLVPHASVLSNTLCGRLSRYPWWRTVLGFPAPDRAEAYAILRNLGLGEKHHRWSCQTSGGEQQRTAIARALFQQPCLYLADEPVSNLDTYLTGRVLGLLRQEAHQEGRTVFCVLHNAELVERFADFVLSLSPTDPTAWKWRILHR